MKELYEALDKFEPEKRKILERRHIKEESFSEIACDMNLGYDRTTYLRNRGLRKIREIIKQKY